MIAEIFSSIRAYQYLLFIACAIQLFNWLLSKRNGYFLLYLLICFTFDVILAKVVIYYSYNNAAFYNLFCSIQPLLILWIYKQELKKHFIKYFSVVSIICTTSLGYAGFHGFNQLHLQCYAIALLVLSGIIGYDLIKIVERDYSWRSLISNPRVFLNFGFIIFFSTSFPILILIENIRFASFGSTLFVILDYSNIALSIFYLLTTLCLLRNNCYSTKSSMQLL